MILKKVAVFASSVILLDMEKHMPVFKQIVPETEVLFVNDIEEMMHEHNDVEAIFAMPFGIQKLVKYCTENPNFKWLQLLTAGCDSLINTPFMDMDNLLVTSTHGIHAEPMSDHVIAFIFAFLRGLPTAFINKQEHKWRFATTSQLDESCNKTIGIIGRGSVGVGIAEKLKKLDFKVLCYGSEIIDCLWFDEFYLTGDLEIMLAKSDFVIVCAPLKDDTYHLMGKEQFNAMKNSAYFINVGRGPIHDQEALIEALKTGEIAGAALDVTDPEPLPEDSVLWDMDNVIITGHWAASSDFYTDRAVLNIAENIRRYNNGEKLDYIFKSPME